MTEIPVIFGARAMVRGCARFVADDGNGGMDYESTLFARAIDPDEHAASTPRLGGEAVANVCHESRMATARFRQARKFRRSSRSSVRDRCGWRHRSRLLGADTRLRRRKLRG